jgi:heme oxygenase
MLKNEVKNNIRALSNKDLIDMIVNGKDYREDALIFAQDEIEKRNINKELYQAKISTLNIEKEIKEFEAFSKEGKIRKAYIRTLSLFLGVVAAFILYRNYTIKGANVFSFEDLRLYTYERSYCNFKLLAFNLFAAIIGILYGAIGLLSLIINHIDND